MTVSIRHFLMKVVVSWSWVPANAGAATHGVGISLLHHVSAGSSSQEYK